MGATCHGHLTNKPMFVLYPGKPVHKVAEYGITPVELSHQNSLGSSADVWLAAH
jgi:hypothetical protein